MTQTPENQAGAGDQIVRLSGMRGMIAGKMLESLSTTAQLTHHAECDATGLLDLKNRLQQQGLKASVEDVLLDVVVEILSRHPGLNGTLVDKEIKLSKAINLGVAVALPGDLLVAPAILDAGSMTLEERVAARRDVVERARTNKLTVTEMTGGTFTITNLGLSRVRHFTPILNAPQLAILGVGETALRPWVHNGEITARKIMGLSLTFDHRAVNGAPAGQFLTDLCTAIEQLG
ncbi:MAG: acetoin dehydrogenase [Alphaproteobacteria bacterium BRH_c36]|nr:MAG: acetoin dehydrogenase [Alphaproteobacteria bacterium BRH_c36]